MCKVYMIYICTIERSEYKFNKIVKFLRIAQKVWKNNAVWFNLVQVRQSQINSLFESIEK